MDAQEEISLIERVARIEERVDNKFDYLGDELKTIKENHLQHLQKDVTDLKIQVATLAVKVGIITAVAVAAIEIIVRIAEHFILK